MQVTLLDYTGAGKSDPAHYAANILIYAKNTRLTQGDKLWETIEFMTPKMRAVELHQIAMSIPSSHEFINYTWQILGVTRAFTHQFVRGRHASYAQQAQRIVDMSSFDTLIPEKIKEVDGGDEWNQVVRVIAEGYEYYQKEGVPAEDCRGLLPNHALTNIMTSMNLRSFAERFRRRSSLRVQFEHREVIQQMALRIMEVHPWTEEFLHPATNKTPALDALLEKALDGRPPASVPEVNDAIKEKEMLTGIWS